MKKDEILVLLPQQYQYYKENLEFSFGKVYILKIKTTIDDIANQILKMKKIKQIIFVNFCEIYRELLPKLAKTKVLKNIFTHYISDFSNGYVLYEFNSILELGNKGICKTIGCLDENLSKITKTEDMKVQHILLNTGLNIKKTKRDSVGILASDRDPAQNFYNNLSAVRLSGINDCILGIPNWETKRFLEDFKINYEIIDENNLKDLLNNKVNLYVTFSNYRFCLFLNSMDAGILCLMGNCIELFDEKLKEVLCVKSDDSINEISHMLKNLYYEDNEMIFKQYKKFRNQYDKLFSKKLQNFLNK